MAFNTIFLLASKQSREGKGVGRCEDEIRSTKSWSLLKLDIGYTAIHYIILYFYISLKFYNIKFLKSCLQKFYSTTF